MRAASTSSFGKVAEKAGEDPDHQRQHDRQVADDQPERSVDQAEGAELEEEGQRERDRREDAGDDREGQQRARARIGELGEAPGGGHRQDEAERGRAACRDQAVDEIAAEIAGERDAVVVERRAAR